jgi:hypothetical protein
MNTVVFYVVTSCTSERSRRFGGIYRPQLKNKSKPSKISAESGGKLSLLSDTEDGSDSHSETLNCKVPGVTV